MSAYVLKLVAIVAMLIDHIGYAFFPDEIIFRIIGRLAFPIFCYFIANGYRYTRNVSAYLLRLILFALISQIPHNLFNAPMLFGISDLSFLIPEIISLESLNIFFTLAAGLVAIICYDKLYGMILKALPEKLPRRLLAVLIGCIAATVICLVSEGLGVMYGGLGVAMIVLFFILPNKKPFLLLNTVLINAAMTFKYIPTIIDTVTMLQSASMTLAAFQSYISHALLQAWGGLSFLPLAFYNGKRGQGPKMLLYVFYPVHLLILAIAQFVIK